MKAPVYSFDSFTFPLYLVFHPTNTFAHRLQTHTIQPFGISDWHQRHTGVHWQLFFDNSNLLPRADKGQTHVALLLSPISFYSCHHSQLSLPPPSQLTLFGQGTDGNLSECKMLRTCCVNITNSCAASIVQ